MNKDKAKGAIDDAAGRAKRQAGEWTGDLNKQMDGAAQQIRGKTEKALGNLKDAAHQGDSSGKEEPDRTTHSASSNTHH